MKTMVNYQLAQAIRYYRLTSVERAYVRGRIVKRPPSRRVRLWLKRNSGQPTQKAISALKYARAQRPGPPSNPELNARLRDLETAKREGASEEQIFFQLITISAEHPEIAWTMHSRTHAASQRRKELWRMEKRLAGFSSSEMARAFNVSKRIVNKALSKKERR
jgi:hypothetical protein